MVIILQISGMKFVRTRQNEGKKAAVEESGGNGMEKTIKLFIAMLLFVVPVILLIVLLGYAKQSENQVRMLGFQVQELFHHRGKDNIFFAHSSCSL